MSLGLFIACYCIIGIIVYIIAERISEDKEDSNLLGLCWIIYAIIILFYGVIHLPMIVGDCIIKAYQKLKYKNDDSEKELE